jgi:hypothetical protein
MNWEICVYCPNFGKISVTGLVSVYRRREVPKKLCEMKRTTSGSQKKRKKVEKNEKK